MTNSSDWWGYIFDSEYYRVYESILTPQRTSEELSFIIKKLRLTKKLKILDVSCGNGRHLLSLARKGFNVTGIDYSDDAVALVDSKIKSEKLKRAHVYKMDARDIKFEKKFNIALNLFTSFGYFVHDEDHKQMLVAINRNLLKGGLFLIDVPNPYSRIINTLKDPNLAINKNYLVTTAYHYVENLGLEIASKDFFDILSSRLISHVTYRNSKGKILKKYKTNIRLFLPHELVKLFADTGFLVAGVFGDFKSTKFNINSSRQIFILVKQKDL